MDFRLTPEDLELRDRARSFTERVLIPLELECEEHDGLSAESSANAKRAVLDAGFNAINHAKDDGGQGFDLFQQILIEEQWGTATGGLWDIPWRPSISLANATGDQRDGTSSRRAGASGATRTRSRRSTRVRTPRWSAQRLCATATPG